MPAQARVTTQETSSMLNIIPSGLAADLKARAQLGRPIRIGLIGSGEMGTDIVTQVRQMEGLDE